jgi:triphosphoribosyl-dephospho-CoA synthase
LSDFEKEDYLHTHGGELYVTDHQLGVRGEAYLGYPTLQKLFTELLTSPQDPYFWHRKLLEIMVTTEDSNLYHRGGSEGVAFAKEKGLETLETLENAHFHDHLVKLDEAFIARHLSPGGSADLLAMLYFLNSINK